MVVPKKVPIDIQQRLEERRAKEAAAARPRFIPKKERERMAAEKQAKEEEEKRERERKERETVANQWRSANDGSNYNAAIPTGPRSMRAGPDGNTKPARKGPSNGIGSSIVDGGSHSNSKKRTYEEMEDEATRLRYLGPRLDQSRFKPRKKQNKDKFNFDWDPSEDTTRQEDLKAVDPESVPDELAHVRKRRALADQIEAQDPVTGQERARQIRRLADMEEDRINRRFRGKHWSEKTLDEMKERDWRIFKEDFGISTKGGGIPNPMRNWQESGLPPEILDTIRQVGYEEPTPIQRAAVPIALQERDLIGVAVTGSGKTAAFLLPLLAYISDLPSLNEITKNDGPYALIIAPTRELVQQIETEARKFAQPLGFNVVSIVGGHSLEEQAHALRDGAEIIVATPGRLVDCIERRLLVLGQCCYIIMDEADRMIDMGFDAAVNKILDALPVSNEKPDTEAAEDGRLLPRRLGYRNKYRQTMMYTATMPHGVEKIAKNYLRRPATVMIGNAGEAVETVEQRVEFIAGEDKRKKRLHEIFSSGMFNWPIIVFVNIKRNCEMVARDIKRMDPDMRTVTLHSDKTQEERERALKMLRLGEAKVLVATDLAGRGIDVPDVSLVINFNMAGTIEAYTHRIGRTGRAGKSGIAITFLGPEDKAVLYDLKQMLSKSSISKVPDELKRHPDAQQKYVKGGGVGKRDEIAALAASGNAGKGAW